MSFTDDRHMRFQVIAHDVVNGYLYAVKAPPAGSDLVYGGAVHIPLANTTLVEISFD